MRARCLVLMGLIVVLLATAQGLTQQPGGSWGGKGGKGGRGFDPNAMFDRYANGRDVVTRAEVDAIRPGSFDRMAQMANITGDRITREQYVNALQQRMSGMGGGFPGRSGGPSGGFGPSSGGSRGGFDPSSRGGPGGGDMTALAQDQFRRRDLNGDGMLNHDEMSESLRIEVSKWDTNRNGLIDFNEYKAYFEARQQQRMAERGEGGSGSRGGLDDPGLLPFLPTAPPDDDDQPKPTVYRAGKLPKDLPEWFQQLDTDTDGQIGLYEWKTSGRELSEFTKIDRNGDGFLTIAEVQRFWGTQAKTDAGGGPGGSSGMDSFGGPGGGGFGGMRGGPGGGGFGGMKGGGRSKGGGPGGSWGKGGPGGPGGDRADRGMGGKRGKGRDRNQYSQ